MVEHSATTSAGNGLHGQGSHTAHSNVSSIKSILGLDRPDSPFGKLAAHTRRKMAELDAARTAAAGQPAAPSAPDWHSAMKPQSFGKAFVKANQTQFFVTLGIFLLMFFWLIVIRTVHSGDAAKSTNSERLQAQVAAQSAAQLQASVQPQASQLQAAQAQAQAAQLQMQSGSVMPQPTMQAQAGLTAATGAFGSPAQPTLQSFPAATVTTSNSIAYPTGSGYSQNPAYSASAGYSANPGYAPSAGYSVSPNPNPAYAPGYSQAAGMSWPVTQNSSVAASYGQTNYGIRAAAGGFSSSLAGTTRQSTAARHQVVVSR